MTDDPNKDNPPTASEAEPPEGDRIAALEEALRESEARLRTVVDALPFDFFLLDSDGRYAMLNAATQQKWGEVMGKRPEDINVPDETKALWINNNRRAFAGETVTDEVAFALDGELHHYLNIITPIKDGNRIRGILGINLDITDRKRLEQERQRVQKLESVGLLAGGIAHDFNNILTAVLGAISMARIDPGDADLVEQNLTMAEEGCQRAADLTEQLLTFASGGAPIRKSTDLGRLVSEASRFALRGTNCLSQLAIAQDLRPAFVDPGQIAQLVQNLCLNAAQAMAAGGTIRIQLDNDTLTDGGPDHLTQGDYLRLQIQDWGTGITDQVLEQVFDPYFTTKEDGHGLGLSIVHSIVTSHQGRIRVNTLLDQGTTVTVHLPASAEMVAPPVPDRFGQPGQGRVLVLDDEASVRDLLEAMLIRAGYEPVTTATTVGALSAVAEAKRVERPFACALIDLTIPGEPGGHISLGRLRELDPDLPAIVTSGYAKDPVLANPAGYGFQGILPKPFRYAELLAALGPLTQPGPNEP